MAETDWLKSPLLTDLYQLTMLKAYHDRGMQETAVFELFVRRLPPTRSFLVAAGLEQAIEYLETLRFSAEDLAALRALGLFDETFLSWLAELRFTGDVDAMPEGTVFFANEPVLRVAAPLPQAQLVESRLVNIVHFQTLIASKAARAVLAARGRRLVDFGMRRAHGAEAALAAARASYLAGFDGTATLAANPRFGIPVFGTMAHSFIQAHDSEAEAFEHFARSHRGALTLLIDTYDTETGAQRTAELARRLAAEGIRIDSVRLDSGDLGELARRVRAILDAGGAGGVRIFASGGLDERQIATLVEDGAPIDGFGVGTALDVSDDAPSLDYVYKLQEYAGRPRRKRSSGKATWPGRKQVFRQLGTDGTLERDIIDVLGASERGTALLEPVLRGGRRVGPGRTLVEARAHAAAELKRLPQPLRALDSRFEYPVEISSALVALAAAVDRETR